MKNHQCVKCFEFTWPRLYCTLYFTQTPFSSTPAPSTGRHHYHSTEYTSPEKDKPAWPFPSTPSPLLSPTSSYNTKCSHTPVTRPSSSVFSTACFAQVHLISQSASKLYRLQNPLLSRAARTSQAPQLRANHDPELITSPRATLAFLNWTGLSGFSPVQADGSKGPSRKLAAAQKDARGTRGQNGERPPLLAARTAPVPAL